MRSEDAEEIVLSLARELLYGWPAVDRTPSGMRSPGHFPKSFPLEFPLGIGDLWEERPRKVSAAEWAQHLLRYFTGQFVSGIRGHRPLSTPYCLNRFHTRASWSSAWLCGGWVVRSAAPSWATRPSRNRACGGCWSARTPCGPWCTSFRLLAGMYRLRQCSGASSARSSSAQCSTCHAVMAAALVGRRAGRDLVA